MPDHDPGIYAAMTRLEKAGFYARPDTDKLVAAAQSVLQQPLVEATQGVDAQVFRDQFYQFQQQLEPLRENLTRDIARLKRIQPSIPHVAPVEIKKREGWLTELGKISTILDAMMHGA
jgi:hypothetical protein